MTNVVKTNQNYFKIWFVKAKSLCIFAQRFYEKNQTSTDNTKYSSKNILR